MNIQYKGEGERLDNFLANHLDLSRSKVQKLISNGQIQVNQETVKNSYLLNLDDQITVVDLDLSEKELEAQNIPLEIIYDDDDIAIINKQKGLVVHPGAGNEKDTLVNALLYHFPNLSTIDPKRPGIVHRLDALTTGLLVIAKNNQAHVNLAKQFANREIKREYYALVWGVIENESGTIDAPIGRDLKNRQRFTVTSVNSKKAITHFWVQERFKKATLLSIKLETGRTHQIRVHFNYIKHPIVNDKIYTNRDIIDDSGQCLHAKTISFKHPKTKKEMVFDSDLPNTFLNILEVIK